MFTKHASAADGTIHFYPRKVSWEEEIEDDEIVRQGSGTDTTGEKYI